MRQCLSVLFIVYRVHVYSFCYLVLPVHQVGLCTAVQGWRETRCTPQSPYTRRRAAPTYTAANLPQPAMLLRGVHNPCNNKIMPKINRSSHFIANKYLRKNFLRHFTKHKIPTLLLSSLVGTGFGCWPISSLPALKEEENRRRRDRGGVRGGGEV